MEAFQRIIKLALETLPDAPSAEVAEFILTERRALIRDWITAAIDRHRKRQSGVPSSVNRRGRKSPDPRQGWFDLPEFQHIRDEVQGDRLEEFQGRIDALELKIRRYGYARLSLEKEKSDRRELREMLRLKKVLIPFLGDDSTMTIGTAFKLYKKQRSKPAAKQRRDASDKRWGRT